ncbi:MAG: radical SAM protein [Deltaproteobacteria bacterium]|nr:radical SAM protein [Deltaproteobacteria bacterium]
MARKTYLIIPVFLPFAGCPSMCVFCDQKGITGSRSLPEPADVRATVELYLSTWRRGGRIEIAFYGGSFTGLSSETQRRYLSVAREYVSAGRVDSVRVSTRPDYISGDVVEMLASYGVDTVELGVQSMSDEVLTASGRGHTAEAAVRAVSILKAAGMKTGIQIMPGLPGDSVTSVLDTVEKVAALAPDFVRIYPTVVLKETKLHDMYLAGAYRPWEMDEMVGVCAQAALRFAGAGIPVIRMGLASSEGLAHRVVAGPYHPSFRQLVEKGA